MKQSFKLWFVTKLQLQFLSHMFCPLLPSWNLYKEEDLSYICTLKKNVSWDEPKELNPLKNLTLKVKH